MSETFLRVCWVLGGAAKWARFFYLLLASAWLMRVIGEALP